MSSALVAIVLVSLVWFLVIPTFTLFFGQPQCEASLDRQPAMAFSNHTLTPATWIIVSNSRYDVWDVRSSPSGTRYSVISDSATTMLMRDLQSMKKVYAVRLACEMADIVYTLGRQTDPLVEVGSMVDTALVAADLGDEGRTQLRQFRQMLDEKAAPALVISSTISGAKEQAKQTVLIRSDLEAEKFLEVLLIGELTSISKAAFLVSLVARAAELMGIDAESWLNGLYDYLAQGGTPLLDIISNTYGSFEATRTLDLLSQT